MGNLVLGVFRSATPAPQTGLDFPLNGAASSDIGIWFRGANLPPRVGFTHIGDYYIKSDQVGYVAISWATEEGATQDDWDNRDHSNDRGCHPFPCDGAFNGSGLATNGSGSSGTVLYSEMAGVTGAVDKIGDVTSHSRIVAKGVWKTFMVTSEYITVTTTNDTIRERYWPDISQASQYIEEFHPAASIRVPANPLYVIGCSPWRANQPSSGRNDETPNGPLRNNKLFSAALSISDGQTEAAYQFNAAVTAAGIASLFYSNINPTPSDISDKKTGGTAHNPEWATANRPALWAA